MFLTIEKFCFVLFKVKKNPPGIYCWEYFLYNLIPFCWHRSNVEGGFQVFASQIWHFEMVVPRKEQLHGFAAARSLLVTLLPAALVPFSEPQQVPRLLASHAGRRPVARRPSHAPSSKWFLKAFCPCLFSTLTLFSRYFTTSSLTQTLSLNTATGYRSLCICLLQWQLQPLQEEGNRWWMETLRPHEHCMPPESQTASGAHCFWSHWKILTINWDVRPKLSILMKKHADQTQQTQSECRHNKKGEDDIMFYVFELLHFHSALACFYFTSPPLTENERTCIHSQFLATHNRSLFCCLL